MGFEIFKKNHEFPIFQSEIFHCANSIIKYPLREAA